MGISFDRLHCNTGQCQVPLIYGCQSIHMRNSASCLLNSGFLSVWILKWQVECGSHLLLTICDNFPLKLFLSFTVNVRHSPYVCRYWIAKLPTHRPVINGLSNASSVIQSIHWKWRCIWNVNGQTEWKLPNSSELLLPIDEMRRYSYSHWYS